MSDQANATVVFYDGGCPLCRREIAHYRRLDRVGALEWLDLHQSGDRLGLAGIDLDTTMARLHVIDPQRGLVSGVPGFVAIWRRLPYYRHLARLVEGLRLAGPLDRVYDRFARWRLRRRCGDGACSLPGR
ncbi:MAG: thiol-disulfide oxidoreductase DCC family protein [Bdellovibrio bacteriovorus]